MQIFHKNKNSRSKDQNKNEFPFILPSMKTNININRTFFIAKRNFISGEFHFWSHLSIKLSNFDEINVFDGVLKKMTFIGKPALEIFEIHNYKLLLN